VTHSTVTAADGKVVELRTKVKGVPCPTPRRFNLTVRHPEDPRSHQRGEGSRVQRHRRRDVHPSQTERRVRATNGATTTHAGSLTRLKYAEFRDDAFVDKGSMAKEWVTRHSTRLTRAAADAQ
jgi:hypothetical protein